VSLCSGLDFALLQKVRSEIAHREKDDDAAEEDEDEANKDVAPEEGGAEAAVLGKLDNSGRFVDSSKFSLRSIERPDEGPWQRLKQTAKSQRKKRLLPSTPWLSSKRIAGRLWPKTLSGT
jgi:hypothetical protein